MQIFSSCSKMCSIPQFVFYSSQHLPLMKLRLRVQHQYHSHHHLHLRLLHLLLHPLLHYHNPTRPKYLQVHPYCDNLLLTNFLHSGVFYGFSFCLVSSLVFLYWLVFFFSGHYYFLPYVKHQTKLSSLPWKWCLHPHMPYCSRGTRLSFLCTHVWLSSSTGS
uniref:Uncharacterized protein n=1 Tax=Cacopsylla melanoneura TaxID=428564 RepID=A0A8D8M517_9HEMI